MSRSHHALGTGGSWAVAIWVTLAAVAIVVGIGAVALTGAEGRERELCRPGVAFREWREVRTRAPGADGREQLVRPVALALVGCDRPLIGLTRKEIHERLGTSEGPPVDSRAFQHWDVGGGDQRDSSVDYLVVRFAGGQVVSAEVTD